VVDGDCYGEERTLLLNRSKIIINLQKYPWEFPVIRLLMAMGCKTLVVSERAKDPGPFVHGRHVIVRDAPDLGEALVRYLEQDEERSRIVDEAHSFVTEHFTLASLLSDALISISRTSATEFSNG
jgi:spore maturation protein CgeB